MAIFETPVTGLLPLAPFKAWYPIAIESDADVKN